MANDDASLLLCKSVGDMTGEGKIKVEQPRSSLAENPSYLVNISELVPVTLQLRLESCGNPDYRQNPERPVRGVAGDLVVVGTLDEAQSKCKAFIENNELGSGNWAGGHVFANDWLVAYISFNGRLWTGETENFRNILLQMQSVEPSI
ncbi:hypothetical protein N9Y42_05465 [Mariniblastus sp.]|nr:hypothetical protein [Mariniblastus sp.]